MNRLKEKYIKEVTPSLVEKFNYSSVMQHPKLIKSLSTWVCDAVSNAKNLDKAVEELALITGQNHLSQKLKIYRWIPFT